MMPGSWICADCGSEVEGLDVCWNCGTSMDGIPDASFPRESDAHELPTDPETPRIQCMQCGYRGKVLFTSRSKSFLEWIIAGAVSIVISQRQWIQFCHKACPGCDSDESHQKPWSGEVSEKDDGIWESAHQKELAECRRQRLNVYFVIACCSLVILLLWFAIKWA